VPLRRPLELEKLAQLGLFEILKRSVLPSGSDAVGWKEYCAPTIASAAGCPEIVGGAFAADAVEIDATEAVKRSATARMVGKLRRRAMDENDIGIDSAQAQNI